MPTDPSNKLNKRTFLLIGLGIVGLIGVSAIVVLDPGSGCDKIFEQAAPRLHANIEIIKNKGGLAVEQQTIQELSDGAQKVGLHLKTCCTVLKGGELDAGQFQQCLDKASAYDRKIEQVAIRVEQAADAQAEGSTEAVEAGIVEIKQGIRSVTAEVEEFSRAVARIQVPDRVDPAAVSLPGSEAEPNNAAAQATELRITGQMDGVISGQDDPDFYKLVATGSLRDRVVLRLENFSESLRPHMTIYNQKKSKIKEVFDYTYGADLEYWFTAEPGTHYYVKVSPWDSSGTYRITATYIDAYDRYEANDDAGSATAFTAGEMLTANVMDQSDADWYRLDRATSEQVSIQLTNSSASLRPHVTVYNANRSKLMEKFDYTHGSSLQFAFDAVPGEQYFVKVSPWDSHGEYELSAR